MGERTKYEPGTFCWVDLSTSDAEGAKAFYGGLFGWQFGDDKVPGGAHAADGGGDGLVAAIDQIDNGPTRWNSFVTVIGVDETAERVAQLGARVIEEPFDLTGAGRMAVIADPEGAVLSLWEPRGHIGARRVNDAGCMSWNELQSREP